MDEKIYELLEKVYLEVQGVKDEVKKTNIIIEQEMRPDIKLALQGYHDINEKLTTIEEKITILSDKVDRHDIKIQVIEGGKRA